MNLKRERESGAQCKLEAVAEGIRGTKRTFVNVQSLLDSIILSKYLNLISL